MSTDTVPPITEWKRWLPTRPVMVAWGVLVVVFLGTYWDTVCYVVRVWRTTPDYEHGFFVPIFSAFLLWHRREMVDPWPSKGTLWGLPFLGVFALWRWINLNLNCGRDVDSLTFLLIGMTLILGGFRALKWAWPSIAFLLFMVPLPGIVEKFLGGFLQHVATNCSVYVLQTVGIPAFALGNVIHLTRPEDQLDVERACCGLKMLSVFVAICVGVGFVLPAPPWKKIILVVSAFPIAIFCNVLRISVTGMLYEWVNKDVGNWIHDNAGWWMMIPAMLMIWGEMALLSALIVETSLEGPLSFGDPPSRRRQAAGNSALASPGGVGPRKDNPFVN
jgi:exosortase